MTGADDLADRIVRLDRGPDNPAPGRYSDIVHFVQIMGRVTDTGNPHRATSLSPSQADEMVAGCALLERVERIAPQIVNGPMATESQFWTGTGKPGHVPPGQRRLSRDYFVPVSANVAAGAKPFGFGLFTSTGLPGPASMWRAYLELHQVLFPLPWWTWSVTVAPDVDVYEIDSAARWVELVSSRSNRHDGMCHPDWAAIATRYDAVHVTARAIVAAQGLCFRTPSGLLAPPYWDVESTFWLRWRFTSAELVERRTAPY